jgi:hypothetical protein
MPCDIICHFACAGPSAHVECRMSIVAMLSLLAFMVVVAADIRSFRIGDYWGSSWRSIALDHGSIIYSQFWGSGLYHLSGRVQHATGHQTAWMGSISAWKFGTNYKNYRQTDDVQFFAIWIPLWLPLLLMLFAPVRWLIARPANAPAFPVVTDAKQT